MSVCPRTRAASEGRPQLEWSSWCPCLWGNVGEGFSLLFPLLVLVLEAVGFCCGKSCKLPNTSGGYYLDRGLLTKIGVFFKVRFKLLQLEEPRTNVKIAL